MNNRQNIAFNKAFGKHIKALRIESGLSIRKFASAADIEVSLLQKIESGEGNPTLSTIYLLAEGLGISHLEIFNFPFPQKK